MLVTETRERQRTVRFADEVEESGGEHQSSKSSGTTSIQDFLLKMAGQPLPDKQVQTFVSKESHSVYNNVLLKISYGSRF